MVRRPYLWEWLFLATVLIVCFLFRQRLVSSLPII
jgi:hypothetical protein